jgi:flavin reductase (DIM6/NTAB) family NADH-FMN oxidoreductase RutF
VRGGTPGVSAVTVDAYSFRDALARFASGVCVVTTVAADGRPAGVTISAFSSLSLDPPLVLFCIGKRSANLSAWLNGPAFSVNVLSERQEALSEVFAAQNEDKFAGVAGAPGANGCFRLDGALITLECRRTTIYDEGDHYIIIGRVDRVEPGADIGPLLRFRGAYRSMPSRR